jgi:maleamate amidohydrolase
MTRPWLDLLSEEDRQRLENARFGRRVGFGERAAVIVIDAQVYMYGEEGASAEAYPSACPSARATLPAHRALLDAARRHGVPVFYTQYTLKRDGSDAGVYIRKRDLLDIEGWCIEGTRGAEIVPELAPQPGDHVLVKKKPSAFIGTPLQLMLIDRQIDTVIVTGGSTSNCVRATAVDAASYNYRTIVVEDCVFDRFDISHKVALFDIDRQYGDVVTSGEVIGYFGG